MADFKAHAESVFGDAKKTQSWFPTVEKLSSGTACQIKSELLHTTTLNISLHTGTRGNLGGDTFSQILVEHYISSYTPRLIANFQAYLRLFASTNA